jgi:hypothetical protein
MGRSWQYFDADTQRSPRQGGLYTLNLHNQYPNTMSSNRRAVPYFISEIAAAFVAKSNIFSGLTSEEADRLSFEIDGFMRRGLRSWMSTYRASQRRLSFPTSDAHWVLEWTEFYATRFAEFLYTPLIAPEFPVRPAGYDLTIIIPKGLKLELFVRLMSRYNQEVIGKNPEKYFSRNVRTPDEDYAIHIKGGINPPGISKKYKHAERDIDAADGLTALEYLVLREWHRSRPGKRPDHGGDEYFLDNPSGGGENACTGTRNRDGDVLIMGTGYGSRMERSPLSIIWRKPSDRFFDGCVLRRVVALPGITKPFKN